MKKKKKEYTTRWLDDAYRGRDAELVTSREIAEIAGVALSTVALWRTRYHDFPQPVKEQDTGPGPTRYFVLTDVIDWLVTHRDETLDDFAQTLDRRIAATEQELARLRDLRDRIPTGE